MAHSQTYVILYCRLKQNDPVCCVVLAESVTLCVCEAVLAVWSCYVGSAILQESVIMYVGSTILPGSMIMYVGSAVLPESMIMYAGSTVLPESMIMYVCLL